MNKAEMNRRLAEMKPSEIERIKELIAEGNGAAGIAGTSRGKNFKQVNAVFKLVELEKTCKN